MHERIQGPRISNDKSNINFRKPAATAVTATAVRIVSLPRWDEKTIQDAFRRSLSAWAQKEKTINLWKTGNDVSEKTF